MGDAHRGADALISQQYVPVQQVVDALEGVGDVVHGRGRRGLALLRHRRMQQRHAVVFLVEGDEREGGVLVNDVAVEDGAVPVPHLTRLAGLEHNVGELRLG